MQPVNALPPYVMVVDDLPDPLELMRTYIGSTGYRVRVFGLGRLALEAAEEEAPDLILLDINMPEMDGYEVCSRLKQNPKLRNIPVLFISSLSETSDKVRGLKVGAVDFVTKPFQAEELFTRMQTHLTLRQLQLEKDALNTDLERQVLERTRQLALANGRLALLDKAKSDFLNLISHELRTPLTGLFGAAELAFEESSSNPLIGEYRSLFDLSRRRILTLVEDALLLTEIETHGDTSNRMTSALRDLLGDALAGVDPLAADKGVAINCDAVRALRVQGECVRLAKALQSLLITAITLSSGGNAVQLRWEEGPGLIRLHIQTTGRRIPAGSLPVFFDVLAIRDAMAGGDLGLMPAVAEKIIRLFGGSVSVENLNPPGVLFHVELKTAE